MLSENILFDEIKPGLGSESFKIMDPFCLYRNDIVRKSNLWKRELSSVIPDFNYFVYKDSISLAVNIHIGRIVALEFYNEYKGKIDNVIGLGSKVSDLIAYKKNLVFDDGNLFYNNDLSLQFKIEVDDFYDLDEVLDKKIVSIIIQNYEYSSIAVWADIPNSWKRLMGIY